MVRFQWAPGHIFPVYPPTSGSHASQRRVNKLKPVALAILTEEAAKVRRAFQTLARGRGKGIQLDLDAACVKIVGCCGHCSCGAWLECSRAIPDV